jgi:hypothetical protein
VLKNLLLQVEAPEPGTRVVVADQANSFHLHSQCLRVSVMPVTPNQGAQRLRNKDSYTLMPFVSALIAGHVIVAESLGVCNPLERPNLINPKPYLLEQDGIIALLFGQPKGRPCPFSATHVNHQDPEGRAAASSRT